MSGGARVCPVLGRGRGGRRCLLLSPFFFPFDGLTFGENNVHTTHARERAPSYKFVTLSTGLAGWLRTAQAGAAAAAPTCAEALGCERGTSCVERGKGMKGLIKRRPFSRSPHPACHASQPHYGLKYLDNS